MRPFRPESRHFRLRLWLGCAVTCLALGVVVLAQTLPGTAVPSNPFEVHGLLYSGSAPSGSALGDGWAQGNTQLGVLDDNGDAAIDSLGAPFRASRQVDENWGNQGDGFDATLFSGGNKNSDLIGVGQEPWGWDVGGGGPQKNDITNAYFHTRVDPTTGDRWVFVAAETRSINGDSHVDFEFNQAGVVKIGTTSGRLTGLGPDGGRTIDDFLISIDFEQGGEHPVASVRAWNGSSFEFVSMPGTVFSATNFNDILHGANGTWKHFSDDGAEVDVLTRLQLVEGAANLTALGINVDPCSTDATFMVKTRSSSSWTADLKDFAIVYFPLEPPPVLEITAPDEVCVGAAFEAEVRETTGLPNTTFEWVVSGCGTIAGDSTANVLTVQADPTCNCDIVLTVTVTGGECNHVTDAQKTVVVDDDVMPTLSNYPADLTVECDSITEPEMLSASDDCSEPEVQYDETVEAGVCVGNSTITRVWTATDQCNNATSHAQIVTVEDMTAPLLSGVPADTTASCDSVPEPALATASDNCSDPVMELIEAVEPGACKGESTITRTWTATDACGNRVSQSQAITVFDDTAPVLSGVPLDITAECDALPAPAEVTAIDNCSEPVVQLDEASASGRCLGESTVTRTWAATDACGNRSSKSQVITLLDTTAPVLIGVPADATVECDSIPEPPQVTATDNCSDPAIDLTERVEPSPRAGVGVITRTWTAIDDCGNQASQTQVITVVDTTAPVLDGIPMDETVECDAIPEPPTVTATDNCASPVVRFDESSEPGPCNGQLTITRTWTATDDCGNQTAQTQTITVVDTTAPTFENTPMNLTAECDSVPPPATVTATDNCSNAAVELSEVEDPGACVGSSTITRTWTATDECGNQASHVQVISVVDTTAPVLSGVPADATASCDSVPEPALVTASDNCSDTVVELIEAVEPGACEGESTITRTWTATDACGNQVSQSQTITVFDDAAPVLSGVPVDVPAECDALPAPAEVTATDNCSEPVVQLDEASASGRCLGESTVTRTWAATDACGNRSSKSQVITLLDTTAPVLIGVPADATVECDSIPEPPQVTATDNCSDPVIELTEQVEPSPRAGIGVITRTWTAIDDCGNQTSQTQVITVVDTTAPVLDGIPVDETVECDAIPEPPTVTATDNCASPVVRFDESSEPGPCNGQLTITRTWTATDDCGNQTTQTQTITVVDTTPPVLINGPVEETAECDSVPPPAMLAATDNCSSAAVEFSEVEDPGACVGSSTITRTWTATDECGNQASYIQIINVVDTTAPVLSDDPVDISAECDSVPSAPILTAEDNCDPHIVVDMAEQTTPGACAGDYELLLIWEATDDCGNSASVSRVVTVQDTIAPVIALGPGGTQFICDDEPVVFTVATEDECVEAELTSYDIVAITSTNRDQVIVTPLPSKAATITVTGPAMVMGSFTATDDCGNVSDPFEFTLFARLGREACSQGFWRNHPEQWGPTGFSPGDLFLDAFEITDLSSPEIPSNFDVNLTLMSTLETTGGSFNQALLQGTAALLNAAHPAVDFPATVDEVGLAMRAAFAGLISFADARAQFAAANAVESECGCPID